MKQIIALLFLCQLIFIGCNAPNNQGASIEDSLSFDSVTVDTSRSLSVSKNSETSVLKDIFVDPQTFKKLYAGVRKSGDDFSETKYLSDKSSPKFINQNGLFCYVSDEKDPALHFKIQYYAEDWLFINTMTFNIDGKNFDFTPNEFKRDNGDGMIWEWSDDTISEADLPLLMKLANGKKAKVKYFGNQYYKVVNIAKPQLLAIKKMLQIYKGLKLGYSK